MKVFVLILIALVGTGALGSAAAVQVEYAGRITHVGSNVGHGFSTNELVWGAYAYDGDVQRAGEEVFGNRYPALTAISIHSESGFFAAVDGGTIQLFHAGPTFVDWLPDAYGITTEQKIDSFPEPNITPEDLYPFSINLTLQGLDMLRDGELAQGPPDLSETDAAMGRLSFGSGGQLESENRRVDFQLTRFAVVPEPGLEVLAAVACVLARVFNRTRFDADLRK